MGRSRAWRRLVETFPARSPASVVWLPGSFWVGRSTGFRMWRFIRADADGLTLSILPVVPNRFGAAFLPWDAVETTRERMFLDTRVALRPRAAPDVVVRVRERHLAKARERVADREGHYHVDVLAGPRREYVRGPTLLRTDDGRYRVHDDCGFAGAPGEYLTDPLPIADALRQALRLVRGKVVPPAYPLWGAAPWKALGYRAGQAVGEDGAPEA